jgi:Tol biopolymer transport system component
MGKVSFIIIIILFTAINASCAVPVENLKKLDISETELWDPVLSPDGTKIAYIAYDEGRSQEIFVMNIDGTGKKKITDDNLKKWGLAWGKKKIAYISFGKSRLEKIFVINPDGTENRELIQDNTRQGNDERYMVVWAAPSWSPDGSRLVYTSLDEKEDPKVYIVNADGTGKRLVLEDAFKQWSPSWSPDGNSIVYISYPELKFKEELFTLDISGTQRKQLTFDEIKKNYPVWGPGDMIVFVSYESVTSSGEKIFTIEDGIRKRFVDSDYKQRSPSFSQDGKKFSYAAIDVSGALKIAVGDIAGVEVTTPLITSTLTTPVPTETAQEVEEPPEEEEEGGFMWTMFSYLAIIVIILLVVLAIVDFFKKKKK